MKANGFHRPVVDVKRAWCGPVALAAITGAPLSAFPRAPRRGGMSLIEVLVALQGYGYRVTIERFPRGAGGRRSLAHVLAADPARRGILATRRHWMAFDGLLVLDSWVQRATWVYDHPLARHRVIRLLTVEPGAGSFREGCEGFVAAAMTEIAARRRPGRTV